MVQINVATDGPLKRELIELAFGDIGSAGYEFGRTPEEVADALLRLNTMMREWPWNALSYNAPAYGLGSADDYSGIPFEVMNGVAAGLTLRIAAVMGATLAPSAMANLATSVSKVHAYTATVPTMPFAANTPAGLGSRLGDIAPFIIDDDDSSIDDDDD